MADITCVPTAEGWLFVAAVMDLNSRQILRWSVWDSLEAGGALQVLNRTLVKRRYPARPGTTPSLHHSLSGDRVFASRLHQPPQTSARQRATSGSFSGSSRERLRWISPSFVCDFAPPGRKTVDLVLRDLPFENQFDVNPVGELLVRTSLFRRGQHRPVGRGQHIAKLQDVRVSCFCRHRQTEHAIGATRVADQHSRPNHADVPVLRPKGNPRSVHAYPLRGRCTRQRHGGDAADLADDIETHREEHCAAGTGLVAR